MSSMKMRSRGVMISLTRRAAEFEHPINHRALGGLDLAEIFTQPQQRLEFRFGNRLRTRRLFAA